jgi:amino acid transporter
MKLIDDEGRLFGVVNVIDVLVVLFVATALASFTGLSYAALASRFPKGEGDYVREAFENKRLAEVIAFLRVFVVAVTQTYSRPRRRSRSPAAFQFVST